MRQEQIISHVVELTNEIPHWDGVCFDPEKVTLQGKYSDQISAYRAKRSWIEALERCFLLEVDHDYKILVKSDIEGSVFVLTCNFDTACARYAFWRLTNEQAPEAQYLIETAHIPDCESRHQDLLGVPDLRPLKPADPLTVGANGELHFDEDKTPLKWVKKLIDQIKNRI